MRSLALGSVAAAAVMFVLGFVFYGLLGSLLFAPLAPETAADVQNALGGSLTATGTYIVPPGDEAWMRGPSAVVNFVAAGDAPAMPAAMGLGFVQFLASAFFFGLSLKAVGGDFSRQARVTLWFAITAAVFMRLGDPIWFGFAWRQSLVQFAADGVMLIAAGLVLARWFTSTREAAPAAAE